MSSISLALRCKTASYASAECHTTGQLSAAPHYTLHATKRSIPLDTLHKTYSILSPILLTTLHNIWNATRNEKFLYCRKLTYIDYKSQGGREGVRFLLHFVTSRILYKMVHVMMCSQLFIQSCHQSKPLPSLKAFKIHIFIASVSVTQSMIGWWFGRCTGLVLLRVY